MRCTWRKRKIISQSTDDYCGFYAYFDEEFKYKVNLGLK